MIATSTIARAPVAAAAPCQEIALRVPLDAGWEMASTENAREQDQLGDLRFIPAQVPGTAASALREQGVWRRGSGPSLDAAEFWFRCGFDAEPAEPGEEIMLEMDGIATLSEVWLNGHLILKGHSMFASHCVDVSALIGGRNELLIACRSLSAALRTRRGQPPQARWRSRVVSEQQLRWFRTTLLGRAPGFAAEPAPVGPWRPVALVRRRHLAVEHWSRQVELDDTNDTLGVVRADLRVRALRKDAQPVSGWLHAGQWSGPVAWQESGDRYHGRVAVRIPNVHRWWPHTHGEPVLYPVRVELQLMDGSTVALEDVPAGFRSVQFDTEAASDAGLSVNGIPVFCRGVIWTPPDPVAFATPDALARHRLELLRDGGFNLIRLAGTMAYESEAFYRLCDELGLLVWQDMMFANMDYPFADSDFSEVARSEAERELSRLARHSSTAIICGNSEVEQQVSMLGLDATLGLGAFFGEELPRIAAQCCPGVPYIPSAPSGGDLPFRTGSGVANYFGVSAYLRPLEDVRRAEVRFASECLAFANVPEQELIDEMALTTPGGISPVHPAWKRGVPRDAGVGWDFEDVRDHYLKLLYSVEPAMLRYAETRRYWELSRMVSGEVMAEVFGEWRRPGSPCGGGIILWSADLEPGAGWGILDSRGCPKAAYWFLKRALAPCSVWTTDEGLNGVNVHVANDGPGALEAWLRVALYAHGERKFAESERAITVAAHSASTFGVEQILGRFVDASCAYRFGPPTHDLIAASLYLRDGGTRRGDSAFAQSFRFPAGRSTRRVAISELGITGHSHARPDGSVEVLLSARRFANGVRVIAADALPDDAYFGIEPGGTRRIVLTPLIPGVPPTGVAVTAVNAEGRFDIGMEKTA
jgi:beta-mannosidase